jgi:hypothetical protein
MARKVFATDKRGYSLWGDDRDIMVALDYHRDVQEWCEANGVVAIVNCSLLSAKAFGVILWRIDDEDQRLVFILRWGT